MQKRDPFFCVRHLARAILPSDDCGYISHSVEHEALSKSSTRRVHLLHRRRRRSRVDKHRRIRAAGLVESAEDMGSLQSSSAVRRCSQVQLFRQGTRAHVGNLLHPRRPTKLRVRDSRGHPLSRHGR